jgi:hypothetical protein
VTNKVKGKIKWVGSTDNLVGLTFFFASLIFFYDLLGGRYILTERDLGAYFIPPRFFWVESIKNGEFPLWNPFQFSGHPLFANPQHAVLYPLNGLFFLLPFDVSFNVIIILHFFLGGLFTYLFLRDLRVNSTGSLISGLIFMLSGYLLSVHSLLTILLSSTWTPLIMMFFRRAIHGQGFKNEILTAILITISFLGGGIEIVYGNFFVLLIMVIFSPSPYIEFVGDKPRRYKFLCISPVYWKRIRSLLIVSILFLSLSAVQLFPFVELFHHSIRGDGISYQEASTWSFAPKDILLFFLPDAYGYFLDMKKYWINQCWFKTLYMGGLPFILCLIFFLAPRSSSSRSGPSSVPVAPGLQRIEETHGVAGFGKNRKLYLVLMLFSLFLSFGQCNPFYPYVFKYLPFFNGIRYPVKFLYIFILVLAIAAGLGFQRLTEFCEEGEKKKFKNCLFLLSLISGLLLLFLVSNHKGIESFLKLRGVDFPDFNHLSVNLFHAKRFLFYLALFFLLLRVGHEAKWKVWTNVLLIFFLTADLFGNMGFYAKEKTSDYFKKTKILETVSSDKGHFRIFSTGKTISLDTPILVADLSPLDIFKEKHLPTRNLLYQLHDIWGIDVIRLKRTDDLYKAFINTPSISATHLIDLYGVKYVVSVTPIEKDGRFELIYSRLEGLEGKKEDLLKANTIKLYKNRSPLSRAWLVKDFKVLDPKMILSMIMQKEFRPSQEVLLEEEPPSITRSRKGGEKGGGEVEILSESNNRIQFLARSAEDNILVLSDTYYPGWKAFVDGKETKIYRADYAFRAIPLNAGTHRVEFVYDPISFKLGAGVTLLGIMGCVGMGWITRRRRSK